MYCQVNIMRNNPNREIKKSTDKYKAYITFLNEI